jgi:hypothetical protein
MSKAVKTTSKSSVDYSALAEKLNIAFAKEEKFKAEIIGSGKCKITTADGWAILSKKGAARANENIAKNLSAKDFLMSCIEAN